MLYSVSATRVIIFMTHGSLSNLIEIPSVAMGNGRHYNIAREEAAREMFSHVDLASLPRDNGEVQLLSRNTGHFNQNYCKVCRRTDFCACAPNRGKVWRLGAGRKGEKVFLKFSRIKRAPKLSACCLRAKFVDTRAELFSVYWRNHILHLTLFFLPSPRRCWREGGSGGVYRLSFIYCSEDN